MKKKIIFVLLVFLALFSISTKKSNAAGCTQVPPNQTTCSGTQPTTCSQVRPPAGNITRWCCDDQTSCDQAKSAVQQEIGSRMATGNDTSSDVNCGADKKGINTAIGCINALGDQNQFLGQILLWAVGVGGGIAFLLIVYAGFMIMTAAGNPERLKAGQELLTSAISGLILLIFSIFILRFIGIDILGLDRFGFGR